MDMQKLFILGRATRDAEIISGKKGKDFAVFTIASNRYMGKEKGEEVTFYDVISFSEKGVKRAESDIKKGDLIFVEGRPEAEAYLSKDGEAKAKIKVVADNWQALK